MRTTMLLATVLSLLTFALPVAAAEPACVEVYPWSELCQGDVQGFLKGMGVEPCLDACARAPPPVECVQVYPWSELCDGNVVNFVCYWVDCDIFG